jgi:cell division protein FtsQ
MRHVTLAARRAQQYLRRPPQPRWLPPPTYIATALLGLGLAFALSSWVMGGGFRGALTAVNQRLLDWSGQTGLVVRKVVVEGRRWTPPEALRSQLDIRLGTPLLAIDTAALRERLEKLAWVERASVARLLPDALQIRLLERQPLALWQRDGRFEVIDRAGAVIEGALHDHPEEYGHLRVLVGDGAPQEAAALFALLSTEPALSSRVVAATRVGGRRWNVHLDHDVEVWLPERDVLGAWRALADKARDDALLERAVSVVDLRFLPERLRLRLDPRALEEGGPSL